MMKKRWFVSLIMLAIPYLGLFAKPQELTHVKGIHAIGLRGGIGTKNKYDVGISYNYHFNPKLSLSVEMDHELAKFGHTDFCNLILFSPGVDYSPVNPGGWSYLTLNLAASVGYDRWTNDYVDEQIAGFVYGANAGIGWEAFPCSFLSIIIKAQQYFLFGNDDQYLKPLFTLGIRYNFHK